MIDKPVRLIELPIGGGLTIGVIADGTIYTLHHNNIRSNGRICNMRGVVIKPTIDAYGYYRCTFSNGGERKSYFVHRLVATAFIPNPQCKPTVNHINGIKTDNRVENLEWATNKEQKIHAIRTGLSKKNDDALKAANERRKIKIMFNGTLYESIKEARRCTGKATGTIRKHGEVVL